MKRLTRRLHRRFRSKKSTIGRKRSGRATRLEQLEPRQLLAADGLASAQSAVLLADMLDTIPFDLQGNIGQPVAISFHIQATDGQLNPDVPQVQDASGAAIPALYSVKDYNGTKDSLLIVELSAGSYQIGVGGEQSTTGSFTIHAGLPGDMSGDGQVTKSEYQQVTAAMVQSQFGFTNISAQVFKKLGMDVSKNLYRTEFDVNSNGKIDTVDQSLIKASLGAPIVQLEFMVDNVGPSITAAMVGDTGSSSTDGITNNLNATIDGSISDAMPIASFTASIDGSTDVDLGGLLGLDFSGGGSFSLSRSQLEQIAGGVTVANNGSHTLVLTAADQQGNSSTQQLTFEFDTVAPAAPTALDLDASSDTGSSNSDNITRSQQLLLHADAETGAIVKFFSSLASGSIGQGTANSPVSATTSTLPEGSQNITATATDVAGNTSSASTGLGITIDITPPTTPIFVLNEESDTGTAGDHLTTLTLITFLGVTSANAMVELQRGGATVATGSADGSGSFMFSGIALPAGTSSFQVVATDLAGNSSTSSAQSVTLNIAPTAENQSFDVSVKYADGTIVGTVAANDLDNDALTYEIVDSNLPEGSITIDESSGAIHVFNAGDLEVDTAYSVTVQVTDEHGDSLASPITVTLNTVANLPLTARDDDATTDEDTAIDVVVLVDNGHGADSDPDDPLVDLTISAYDSTSAMGATITQQVDGTLHYDPTEALNHLAAGETAVDTFTYTIMDPGGATSMATVTVTVTGVNDPPTPQPDDLMTDEDTLIQFDPLLDHMHGPDTDPDTGDTLVLFSVALQSEHGGAAQPRRLGPHYLRRAHDPRAPGAQRRRGNR